MPVLRGLLYRSIYLLILLSLVLLASCSGCSPPISIAQVHIPFESKCKDRRLVTKLHCHCAALWPHWMYKEPLNYWEDVYHSFRNLKEATEKLHEGRGHWDKLTGETISCVKGQGGRACPLFFTDIESSLIEYHSLDVNVLKRAKKNNRIWLSLVLCPMFLG